MEVVMINYIQVLRIPILILFVFALPSPALAAAGSENKPNIVLVLMDNFGYGEIGVYGRWCFAWCAYTAYR